MKERHEVYCRYCNYTARGITLNQANTAMKHHCIKHHLASMEADVSRYNNEQIKKGWIPPLEELKHWVIDAKSIGVRMVADEQGN